MAIVIIYSYKIIQIYHVQNKISMILFVLLIILEHYFGVSSAVQNTCKFICLRKSREPCLFLNSIGNIQKITNKSYNFFVRKTNLNQ